jgi:hypothetical protein
MRIRSVLRLENHLSETFPVTQVDEYGSPVVPAILYPAEEDHVLAHVGLRELAAGMGAFHLRDELDCHGFSL